VCTTRTWPLPRERHVVAPCRPRRGAAPQLRLVVGGYAATAARYAAQVWDTRPKLLYETQLCCCTLTRFRTGPLQRWMFCRTGATTTRLLYRSVFYSACAERRRPPTTKSACVMRLNASPGALCSAPLALLLCATDLLLVGARTARRNLAVITRNLASRPLLAPVDCALAAMPAAPGRRASSE
jgi:hypothetical protein